MGDEWRHVALEDVADDITVGHVGSMASEYVESGVPFLRSLNVEPFRINATDLRFITPAFHAKLKKSTLSPGDVVIVRTGKPGATAIVPEWLTEANCSDLVIVRPGRELDRRFLVYFMNSVAQRHVAAHLVGAVQQHFNVGSARTLRLHLPPLSEQQAIACILGSLDDKIELNRRRSRTLEAMARAIFQSWFVDFDPVHAKAAGEKPPGLTAELAAIFPDRLEDSPLGPIPVGWRVGTIGDLADIVGGGTPSTKNPEFWNGGTHHFATPKDLSSLSIPVLLDTERKITDDGLAKISSGLLPVGTVLLSSRAPIGYLAIAQTPVAINQGFIAMKSKAGIPERFLLRWAQCSHETIVSRANGSTFLEISKVNFRPIQLVIPDDPVLAAFDRISAPMFEQVVNSEQESRTLAASRDALLPKLISGELRVGSRATMDSIQEEVAQCES